MRPRLLAVTAAVGLVATAVPASALTHQLVKADPSGPLAVARDAAPVVLTGSQIPAWAEPAAQGLAKTQPSGANTSKNPFGDNLRSAHNGTVVVPPLNPAITPVDPSSVAAYSWVDGGWKEIPVQVDERFPYFLANGRSDFGFYSGTDEELTYAWASDAGHDNGEESWKKMFGDCTSRFGTPQEISDAVTGSNGSPKFLTPGQGETEGDYTQSMSDPQKYFDTDDELSFMARDAGGQAPAGQGAPSGASDGQVVTITDPLDPTTLRYVYLFTNQTGGSSYNAANGYVRMTRNSDSEQWIDRYSFDDNDPMKIGTSNTSYGPNLPGTVCDTSAGNAAKFNLTPDPTTGAIPQTPRPSTDRQPRDDFTIDTPTYQVQTTGRWLVQGLRVAPPHSDSGQGHAYGRASGLLGDDLPDYGDNVIARWKGRAFQQTPNSSISVVGFEDEQVNWELNSALLGWRQGPVRAIREIWGADSGTNVTKTEYYYRDADVYSYHVRVHPIPADGLYTDWDYRPDVATTYYNLNASKGVPIDGVPDANVGEVDQVPVTGQDAETNVCDPTTQVCSALDAPEEVAGNGFGLVYEFELTGATAAAGNVAVVPYYRDDRCFDDGTGDAPVQRPFPGDANTDNGARVEKAYIDNAIANGAPADLTWDQLVAECHKYAGAASWARAPFQGAIGEHGVHFFMTQDSDNTFSPKNTDEIDGQQWRFEVPMASPTNVLVNYGANVSNKLQPVVTPFAG